MCGRSIYAEGTIDAVLFLAKKVRKPQSPFYLLLAFIQLTTSLPFPFIYGKRFWCLSVCMREGEDMEFDSIRAINYIFLHF